MKDNATFSLSRFFCAVRRFFAQSAGQKTVAVLLAVLVWQLGAMLIAEELILVSPLRVLARLFTIWREPDFFAAIGHSLLRIALGFFSAFILGTVLAVLAGRFRFAEILLFPYMAVVKAVPVVSFIVLAYVWMSSRMISAFIAFLIVLPTVYTSLLSGIKARDEKLEEMADVFGVSAKERFLYLRLPNLAPYVKSSVSLGIGLAFKSGIAAEIIAVPSGSMGEMMYYAGLWLQNVDLFTWTVVLLLLSIVAERLLTLLLTLGFRRIWRK